MKKQRRIYRFAWIFVLFIVNTTFTLANDLKFTHLTKNEGLSNNTITVILKDSRGFMWIGTNEGLNLFNGYTIISFYKEQNDSLSISHNIINCIFEDSKGRIWVGTRGGGLNLYNRISQKFTAYKHSQNKPKSISSNNVLALAEDYNGNLWVGTSDGLCKLDVSTKEFKRYKTDEQNQNSLTHNYITDIIFDKNNQLWIATYGGGISVLDISSDNFTNFQRGKNSINDNEIWDIFIDSDEMIWIGTANGGLNFYNPFTSTFKVFDKFPKEYSYLFNTNVVHITEDIFQNLWFATDRGGLYQIAETTGEITAYMNDPTQRESLASNALTRVFCDEQGVFWVGTYDKGLDKTNLNQMNFRHIRNKFNNINSLSDNSVNAILEDKNGNLWIGTEKGLNYTNKSFSNFKHFFALGNRKTNPNDNVILSLLEHSNGKIWFGGYTGGINMMDPQSLTFQYRTHNANDPASLAGNFVRCLHQDKNGNLWAGSVRGGLSKYMPLSGSFQNYLYDIEKRMLSNSNVMSIVDGHGKLYIGTFGGGLNVLDLKTGSITYLTHFDNDEFSISDNQIITLFLDSEDQLWVGTNRGLNLFNPSSNSFKKYYQKDGLASNSIMGILEDDKGYLWISTTDGISKFNKNTEECLNFYKEDGLQGDVFIYNSCAKLSDGSLAFGGTNGLSVFNPELVNIYRDTPKVIFTNFELFNRPVKVGPDKNGRIILDKAISEANEIKLNYRDKLFTIEFSTLTYYSSKQVNFAYRLDKEENWINLGTKNFISFHNLKPGKYNLELRTISQDGKTFGGTSTIRIVISPEFWRSLWFKAVSALSIVLLILAYYFNKMNRIKKRRKLLEQKVFEKTIEIRKTNEVLNDQKVELEMQNEEISTQRDFAEQQKIEIEKQNIELELHRNDLEQLVVARTKDLVKAKVKAEESDRLKSAFLANMSHEIRTPLNAIIGFSEILINSSMDESHKEYLNSIKLSGRTLLSLINDILDLSKIEAGRMTIRKDVINIQSIFFELGQIFGMDAELKGISLFTEVSTNVPDLLELDELRIRQVLINLINNAIKFTHEGYIKVKADAEICNKNLNLFLSVEDTGIGIKEGEQEKIFEAFNQSDSYESRNYEGTGLGLAIISRIVGLFNGNIKIKSKIGKGSTFIIELPDVKIHTDKVVKLTNENIKPNCFVFRKGSILVVDDKENNIKVVKGLLKQYNFEILEANNGIEAIDIALNKLPNLIFMDLKMPEMNGYQATKFLKLNEKTRHIPIVVLTATVLGFNDNLLDEYGFSGYLPKPVEFNKLVLELSKFLPHEIIAETLDTNKTNNSIDFFKENSDLKAYLKKNVLNTWKQLQVSRTSKLEKEFVLQLIKAGEMSQNAYLLDKGKSMKQALETFNIEKLKTIQDELLDIFNELKND